MQESRLAGSSGIYMVSMVFRSDTDTNNSPHIFPSSTYLCITYTLCMCEECEFVLKAYSKKKKLARKEAMPIK